MSPLGGSHVAIGELVTLRGLACAALEVNVRLARSLQRSRNDRLWDIEFCLRKLEAGCPGWILPNITREAQLNGPCVQLLEIEGNLRLEVLSLDASLDDARQVNDLLVDQIDRLSVLLSQAELTGSQ